MVPTRALELVRFWGSSPDHAASISFVTYTDGILGSIIPNLGNTLELAAWWLLHHGKYSAVAYTPRHFQIWGIKLSRLPAVGPANHEAHCCHMLTQHRPHQKGREGNPFRCRVIVRTRNTFFKTMEKHYIANHSC